MRRNYGRGGVLLVPDLGFPGLQLAPGEVRLQSRYRRGSVGQSRRERVREEQAGTAQADRCCILPGAGDRRGATTTSAVVVVVEVTRGIGRCFRRTGRCGRGGRGGAGAGACG